MADLPARPEPTSPRPNRAARRHTTSDRTQVALADGATKPTSIYTTVEVENALAVIAHLSEALPRYWLIDNSAVQQWLTTELLYGLQLGVEAKAIADINATSGIQTAAYSNSVLETLRKSVTKLEVVGLIPAWFLMHRPTGKPWSWPSPFLPRSSTAACLSIRSRVASSASR